MKLAVTIKDENGNVVNVNLDISLNGFVKFATQSAHSIAKKFRADGGSLDQVSEEFVVLMQQQVVGDLMKKYIKLLATDSIYRPQGFVLIND